STSSHDTVDYASPAGIESDTYIRPFWLRNGVAAVFAKPAPKTSPNEIERTATLRSSNVKPTTAERNGAVLITLSGIFTVSPFLSRGTSPANEMSASSVAGVLGVAVFTAGSSPCIIGCSSAEFSGEGAAVGTKFCSGTCDVLPRS